MWDRAGGRSGIVATEEEGPRGAEVGHERRALPATLRVAAVWDGERLTASLPEDPYCPDAGLLVGRTVGEALALARELGGANPVLHGIASTAALAAAGARGVSRMDAAAEERAIAAETGQEHLCRLVLDWPALFRHFPRRDRFDPLYRRLAQCAGARTAFDLGGELLDLVAVELMAGFFNAPRGPSALREFLDRARRGGAIGETLADLVELGPSTAEKDTAPLRPMIGAEAWAHELGGVPSPEFCRQPTLYGQAFETGALARHAESQLVRILVGNGHRIAARLFARVIDLADCASRMRHPLASDMPALVDAAPFGVGGGLAWVETARGLLLHAVRLDGDRVAEYAVIAPNQWNFQSQGAFAREASGWAAPSREIALLRLSSLVLALDPGIEREIVLKDMTATQ